MYKFKIFKYIKVCNSNIYNDEDMSLMFMCCYKLKYIDFSEFDAKNVKNMIYMSHFCESLKYVNLSNFSIDIKNTDLIFSLCYNLRYINLSNSHFKFHDNYNIKTFYINTNKNNKYIPMLKLYLNN